MSDIFVSYARPDEAKAQAIAEALRELGYGVWRDDQLPAHRAYADVIAERLSAAKAVVVLWSAHALTSQWVRAEADVARQAGTLVQFSLDGSMPPLPFNQIQCADLRSWSGEAAAPGWRKGTSSIADLMGVAARVAQTELSTERRHLIVLSCCLVRPVIFPALDPEEWHAVTAEYREMVAGAAKRFSGLMARAFGEGQIVYFGYPLAQEDAAERAVRMGLAITEEISGLAEKFPRLQLVRVCARVAVHAGSVFVTGHGPGAEISGDVPDISSRAQAAAPPGVVVLTESVHQLVADLFDLQEIEPLDDDGKPLRLFGVISGGTPARRARGFSRPEQTVFVGREDEMQVLLGRWRAVCAGEGQLVLLLGEPGIGKTRLVEEFRARIRSDPHLWTECGGAPLFANTPFHTVAGMLSEAVGSRPDEPPDTKFRLLEQFVRANGMDLDETFPLLAELLNLPVPAAYPSPSLPEQKRSRLLAALVGWLLSATTNQPRIVVVEDLHWVDPSTSELLETLAEQCATAPLLLLCTARQEFRPPWPSRAHHTQLAVGRLKARAVRDLVGGMTSGDRLDAGVAALIIQRTDGVPLFAEELVRLVQERGRAGAHEIPANLQDSLAARLDRLGEAKQIAQLGAVLGREFSYELLRAVSVAPERDLQTGLLTLADADVLQVRGMPPNATYRFRHALIQDAAYAAMLKTQQRDLHRRVAQTIVERFPNLAEAQPEVIARHWSAVGDAEKAVEAWSKGAKAATMRHAYTEAAEDHRLALEMLATIPETPERDTRELQLLTTLVGVLQITHGFSAATVERAMKRARELAEGAGDVRTRFVHLFGEWAAKSSAGEYLTASKLAEQLLTLAQVRATPGALASAYMALLSTRNHAGDLVGAEEAFETGQRHFNTAAASRRRGDVAQIFGNAAINAWLIGNSDEARSRIERVRALISTSDDPYELAFGQYMVAMLALLLGDFEEARALGAQSIERSVEGGFPQFAATSSIVLGCAYAKLGDTGQGLPLMLSGLAGMDATGNRSGMTLYLNWLAESRLLASTVEQALEAVERSLSVNPAELYFRPESLRLRAEVRLRMGESQAAIVDLQGAIELARSIGATELHERAAASLEKVR